MLVNPGRVGVTRLDNAAQRAILPEKPGEEIQDARTAPRSVGIEALVRPCDVVEDRLPLRRYARLLPRQSVGGRQRGEGDDYESAPGWGA